VTKTLVRRLRRQEIIMPLILAFCLIDIAIAVVVTPLAPDLLLNVATAGASSATSTP
jgi:hypothetical protein